MTRACRPRVRLAVALVLATTSAAIADPAAAFVSIPPGDSVHDHVTQGAAGPLGFSGENLDALMGAVRHPDLDETRVGQEEGHAVALAGKDYEPFHHCDRLPSASHREAFAVARAYVGMERDLALQLARSGASDHAMRAVGKALHTLQDCHSHSDIVDRAPDAQAAFQRALAFGADVDVEVRLTGFRVVDDADASNWPLGDPYPHGSFNKDETNATPDAEAQGPGGGTKFEAAKTLAVQTTRMFLEGYLANLTMEQRAAFFAVRPEAESQGIPGLSGAVPAAALLALAVVAARRGRRS